MSSGHGIRRNWTRIFPRYRPGDLFALVADIEAYPAFVPGCQKTRIVRRHENVWQVENVFGFGPLNSRFSSKASLTPEREISILSEDGVWRRFQMNWRFEQAETGCLLICDMVLEFKSTFLNGAAALTAEDTERRFIDAFERRAEKLFGRASANQSLWGDKQ
jgi:coenzyme Q-binding protein COQ10